MLLLIIFITIAVVIGAGIFLLKQFIAKADHRTILHFIEQNKKTKNCSVAVLKNGRPLIMGNVNVPLPLASTVKIMIAIEYARQCGSNVLNPEQFVSLEDISKFYVPNTDGNAHKEWMSYVSENGLIIDNKIKVSEVAKGMMMFSSNANSDFLIDLLGEGAINKTIKNFGLASHESISPFAASLFVPGYIKKERKIITNKDLLFELTTLSREEYRELTWEIHGLLRQRGTKLDIPLLLADEFQEYWSNHLVTASANDYLSVLRVLNKKDQYHSETQRHLNEVFEFIMKTPENQEKLIHAGQKGGSTNSVLTKAVYAKDKKGNTTEIVFMARALDPFHRMKLQRGLNDFILQMIYKEESTPNDKSKIHQAY